MTPTTAVLTFIADPELAACVDRVAAAAGVRVVRGDKPTRRSWQAAAVILLDEEAALRCADHGMPRRDGVVLLSRPDPAPSAWSAAIGIGAESVYTLPEQEENLVRSLSEALDRESVGSRSGRVVAVVSGRGGAGASVFAAAVAMVADPALLIDLDAAGGGADLLLGVESKPGLRWPDLGAQSGRLNWSLIREVMPRLGSASIVSSGRTFHEIEPRLVSVMADAGRRGGATVVCDVPRQLGPAAMVALEQADLIVVVTVCDVRGIAAAAALTGVLRTINTAVGLVVRGPAPGGLTARDATEVVGVPLLAALRPEPALDQRIERSGLRLGRRSRLRAAAAAVVTGLESMRVPAMTVP